MKPIIIIRKNDKINASRKQNFYELLLFYEVISVRVENEIALDEIK